jgi:hypothetical protein
VRCWWRRDGDSLTSSTCGRHDGVCGRGRRCHGLLFGRCCWERLGLTIENDGVREDRYILVDAVCVDPVGFWANHLGFSNVLDVVRQLTRPVNPGSLEFFHEQMARANVRAILEEVLFALTP